MKVDFLEFSQNRRRKKAGSLLSFFHPSVHQLIFLLPSSLIIRKINMPSISYYHFRIAAVCFIILAMTVLSTSGTKKSGDAENSATKITQPLKDGFTSLQKSLQDQANKGGTAMVQLGSNVTNTTTKATSKAAKSTAGAFHHIERVAKKTTDQFLSGSRKLLGIQPASRRNPSIFGGPEDLDRGGGDTGTPLPRVAPDETLQSMNIILKKRIAGMTVAQFYDLIWSEGHFYEQWLEQSGKYDISVQPWETAEGGPDLPFAYSNSQGWKDDATHYGRKRVVDFTFTRTTHLYTGPPVAKVKQIQFGRLTEDRCIVQIQVEMEGIPFANCFNVQIRWVATRGGTTTHPTLQLEIGLHVNFVEQTILAGKIRSGTTEETTKTQRSLLQAVVKTCQEQIGKDGGALIEDDYDDISGDTMDSDIAPPAFACIGLPRLFGNMFKKPRTDSVGEKARAVQQKLQELLDSLDDLGELDPKLESKVESEMTDIQASLGTIGQYLQESKALGDSV